MKKLQAEIRKSLESKIDLEYQAKIRELVPAKGSLLLGVRVPEIRELVKEFATRHKDVEFADACGLVSAFFASGCREEMLFGVFLLARYKKSLTSELWSEIDGWIDSIDNWEVCDQLAMGIAAPIVAQELKLVKELIACTRSKNLWRRRFAVACSAPLNQKGRNFAAETLAVCTPLLGETEPAVQKAVGWALREACKSDKKAVTDLLLKKKSSVHPKILREVL